MVRPSHLQQILAVSAPCASADCRSGDAMRGAPHSGQAGFCTQMPSRFRYLAYDLFSSGEWVAFAIMGSMRSYSALLSSASQALPAQVAPADSSSGKCHNWLLLTPPGLSGCYLLLPPIVFARSGLSMAAAPVRPHAKNTKTGGVTYLLGRPPVAFRPALWRCGRGWRVFEFILDRLHWPFGLGARLFRSLFSWSGVINFLLPAASGNLPWYVHAKPRQV